MKTTIHYLVIICLLVSIIFGCSSRETDKSTEGTNSQSTTSDSIRDAIKRILEREHIINTSPIGFSEYNQIIGMRYNTIDIGDSHFPNFVDPVLNAEDFYNFLVRIKSEGFNGIRIYPGLTTDKKLVLILCATSGGADEAYYKVFNYGDYTDIQNPILGSLSDLDESKTLHISYIANVRINKSNQPLYPESDNSFRKSRYYTIEEINSFMKDNIPGLDFATNPDFKKYRLKLEFGFVPVSLLDAFHQRVPVNNNPILHYGYTIVFQILNDKGLTTLHSDSSFNSKKPNSYQMRALEVGSPCPPVCGVLHPN